MTGEQENYISTSKLRQCNCIGPRKCNDTDCSIVKEYKDSQAQSLLAKEQAGKPTAPESMVEEVYDILNEEYSMCREHLPRKRIAERICDVLNGGGCNADCYETCPPDDMPCYRADRGHPTTKPTANASLMEEVAKFAKQYGGIPKRELEEILSKYTPQPEAEPLAVDGNKAIIVRIPKGKTVPYHFGRDMTGSVEGAITGPAEVYVNMGLPDSMPMKKQNTPVVRIINSIFQFSMIPPSFRNSVIHCVTIVKG